MPQVEDLVRHQADLQEVPQVRTQEILRKKAEQDRLSEDREHLLERHNRSIQWELRHLDLVLQRKRRRRDKTNQIQQVRRGNNNSSKLNSRALVALAET